MRLAKIASLIAANKARDVYMSVAQVTLCALKSLRALESSDAVVDEFSADDKKHRVDKLKENPVTDPPV